MDESKHKHVNIRKWNRWSSTADNRGGVYDYLRRSQGILLSMIEMNEGLRMLDMGCGTGWALGQAASRLHDNGCLYGVDIAPGMINKAAENFRDRNNFHFVVASSENVPLESDFFDVIICTNSFHHYLHPQKSMNEISRLLRKGGKIHIVDPTADNLLVKLADWILKIFEPAHVKIHSTVEFIEMMKAAGLTYIGNKAIQGMEKVHTGQK